MKQFRLTGARFKSSSRVSVASVESLDNTSDGATTETPQLPTLTDVVGMLQALTTKVDTRIGEVKELHSLRENCETMQAKLKGLREEITGLCQKNEELQKKNEDLNEKIVALQRKTDDLEGRSNRNNLIFYGL
ncbi:hypothetical protein ACOMHN_031680 [Nucella lapillus]